MKLDEYIEAVDRLKEILGEKDGPKGVPRWVLEHRRFSTPEDWDGCGDGSWKHRTARISDGVSVGPRSVVLDEATVGAGSELLNDAIVGSDTKIGSGVHVGSMTSIGPRSTIEDGAEIGVKCVISDNVIIKRGAKIGSFARIHAGSIVCESASVGRDAMVLSGAIIRERGRVEESAVIGHFAVVGEGSRVAENCWLGARSYLGHRSTLAPGCHLAPHQEIDDNVRVLASPIILTANRFTVMASGPETVIAGGHKLRLDSWREEFEAAFSASQIRQDRLDEYLGYAAIVAGWLEKNGKAAFSVAESEAK